MIFYFENNVCNESKGVQNTGFQINDILYGLSIFTISTHERSTKWPNRKDLQVGNGFPM